MADSRAQCLGHQALPAEARHSVVAQISALESAGNDLIEIDDADNSIRRRFAGDKADVWSSKTTREPTIEARLIREGCNPRRVVFLAHTIRGDQISGVGAGHVA